MYLSKGSSSPFYQIVFLRNGKRTKISTKTRIKSEALKFLSEFQKHSKKEETKPIVKLQEFEKEYLEYIQDRRRKSYLRSVKLSFKMFIEFAGNIELDRINRKTIEQFIGKTFHRTESGAALYFRSLKAAFSKAEDWGLIERNPFYRLKQPKPKSKLPSFLTEPEFYQLIGFVKEPGLRNLYTVLFYTGIRAGEGVNIQLSDIDFINRTLIIRNKESFTTKSGKERIIPLNDLALQALRDQIPKVIRINSEDYIFWRIEPRIPLPVEFCSKKFKGYIRKAGLNSGLKLHSLRHSFCSNLVNRGVSLYTVQALAGHSSPNVTKIYSHFQDKTLIEAVNLLGRGQDQRSQAGEG